MKMIWKLVVLLTMLLAFFTACGSGGDGPNPPVPDEDFETTPIQEGNYGANGEYRAEYFNNAEPAKRQLQEVNYPNVIGGSDNYYILDIQEWPADWDIGKIVVVRQQNGLIEYKRLMMRFELTNGQLAIGVKEASVLEAIDNIEITSNGIVQQTSTAQHQNAANVVGAAALVDYDFHPSMNFDIIHESNVNLYEDDDHIVSITFPEISLSSSSDIDVSLKIDKPTGVSDLYGKAADLVKIINNAATDAVDNVGEGTLIYDNKHALIRVSSDNAELIVNSILLKAEVAEAVESIHAVLLDRTRLKEGHISVNGSIDGTIKLAASASGAFPLLDTEIPLLFPVLIPVAGPVPIYLEFELIGELTMLFEGKLSATTGIDVTIPIDYSFDVINGEIQPMIRNDSEPVIEYDPLSVDGTQAGFELTAGLQVECGLTVAKIISASVDPTISMVFETTADVTGSVEEGCVDLDWDLFFRFDVESEVELSTLIQTWEFSTDKATIATLLEDEFPNSTEPYHTCWGEPDGAVGTVTSATGRIWMDRNLGASRVATSSTDSEAYGDLYQWGRKDDGHEKRTSATTSTTSSSDTPGHGNFITTSSAPYDWLLPQNNGLWQGDSGTNNPCPNGFRLPTKTELDNERLSWTSNNSAGAFASPLKLVVAGNRSRVDGSLYNVGSNGLYWSSTVNGSYSRVLNFSSGVAYMYGGSRAYGFSARCVED